MSGGLAPPVRAFAEWLGVDPADVHAVGIAFDNDPQILGAITAILVLQIVVGLVVASFWAKDADTTSEPEPVAADA